MLDLAFRLSAVPGAEDDLAAAVLENAIASRAEPGAVRFDVFRSTTEPGAFLVVERYVDEAAFEAHRQTPHYLAWKAASAGKVAATERFEPWAEGAVG